MNLLISLIYVILAAMIIYFTASIAGKKHYLENYNKILNILKLKKVDIISDHIIKSEESQIRMETKEDRLKFQAKLNNWITSSDCVIAETSFPSISVGYEISMALNKSKPVLILYSGDDPPTLLAHHKDEKLICERYAFSNLKDIIDDFITYVKDTEGIRFTFFLTSELSSYLEDVSKKDKIPKAVYIRKLLREDMLRTG